MPSEEFAYLSSTLIREVVRGGGDVSRWVTPEVARVLRERLAGGTTKATGKRRRKS